MVQNNANCFFSCFSFVVAFSPNCLHLVDVGRSVAGAVRVINVVVELVGVQVADVAVPGHDHKDDEEETIKNGRKRSNWDSWT